MSDVLLTHASLDTYMSDTRNAEDVARLVHTLTNGDSRDLITLTETHEADTLRIIAEVVHETGRRYTLVNPDSGDVSFLVHKRHDVIAAHGDLVIPAVHRPAADGGHGPRYNSRVRVNLHLEDGRLVDLTHFGCHFVTAHVGKVNRTDQQVRQARALGYDMRRASLEGRIATGSGDLNAVLPGNRAVQAAFDSAGLTTTAHETGVDDPTHGATRLDYVWTRDSDRRVKVDRMMVRHGAGWNSDHDPIDVWLTIAGGAQ